MSLAQRIRRQARGRAHHQRRPTDSTRIMAELFGMSDELHWYSTRKGAFLAFLDGERANGARIAYETELDPGALDAGTWCPFDPGGAEAYDAD